MISFLDKLFRPSTKSERSVAESTLNNYPAKESSSLNVFSSFEVDYKTLTILIIDDNTFVQDTMKLFLENLGITVDSANNGQAGLEAYLAAPDKYDMILMDIEMPVMGGFKAAKHIRESGCASANTTPIVAVTGSIFSDDSRMPLFDGNIKKPFALESLSSLIKQMLLRQHMSMQLR